MKAMGLVGVFLSEHPDVKLHTAFRRRCIGVQPAFDHPLHVFI